MGAERVSRTLQSLTHGPENPFICGFLTNFFPFDFFFDSVVGSDRFRPLLAALAISFWGNKPINLG